MSIVKLFDADFYATEYAKTVPNFKSESAGGIMFLLNNAQLNFIHRSFQFSHDRSVGVVRDKPRQNDHRSSILLKLSGPSSFLLL